MKRGCCLVSTFQANSIDFNAFDLFLNLILTIFQKNNLRMV